MVMFLFNSILMTLSSSSPFSFLLFLLSLVGYFLSNINLSNLSIYYFSQYMMDETALFLSLMTFFVMLISYLVSPYHLKSLNICFTFMLFFSFLVFISSNIFFIYLFYEASLLPIIYIIMKWGSYPERSLSALMLLIYTAVFSFPFIIFLFLCLSNMSSLYLFSLSFMNFTDSALLSFLIFFAFSVKLPIYGLHFWLPMAHVEAPTFGSMILAGILLKLGGLGLMRLSFLTDLSTLFSLCSYFIIFLPVSTMICCTQSDFKRMIAYSSVSHMMAIPMLFLISTVLSNKAILMVMFFHGLSSPLLFLLVGLVYSQFGTRQLAALRGLVTLSPLLMFVSVIVFFMTMSAPPFPSFVGEILFFISSYQLSSFLIPSLCIFAFLSLIYNLHWLSSIYFSSVPSNINNSFTMNYSSFTIYSLSMILCISFIILVSFF